MLIILSAVLGSLLAALAIVYFLKTRSYGRKIKALTDTNFGSNSTNLNRNIQILPNTNMFSNEKSNPIMNNSEAFKSNLDTESIISSDSDDFAGLNDNPIFNVKVQPDNGNIQHNSSYT